MAFCPECGSRIVGKEYRCPPCTTAFEARWPRQKAAIEKRNATMRERYPHKATPKHADFKWQQWAMGVVQKAKACGLLPQLDGSIACTDCDGAAYAYDHRDYSRPLDVEPVCQSCNLRRGTAKWPQSSDYQFKRIDGDT